MYKLYVDLITVQFLSGLNEAIYLLVCITATEFLWKINIFRVTQSGRWEWDLLNFQPLNLVQFIWEMTMPAVNFNRQICLTQSSQATDWLLIQKLSTWDAIKHNSKLIQFFYDENRFYSYRSIYASD